MLPTKRQAEVLKFIRSYTEKYNYAPTYQEIADGLGLSAVSTVSKHIYNLHRKGLVTYDGGYRSVRISDTPVMQAVQLLRRWLAWCSGAVEVVETRDPLLEKQTEEFVSRCEVKHG